MNKIIAFCISLLCLNMAFGAPCGGAPGANHQNPDGSTGGFVAKTATVAKTSYVDASSSVCERAKVEGNTKLKNGTEVGGEANVFGNASLNSSRVKGLAKVYGNAVVTNSSICQMSDINFSVTGSDYYCATGDEEPKDPGELGKKTVLGIDSNVNGIRDDVEIWINNNTTNTPKKNMYNERMALRQIATEMGHSIKAKDNTQLVREAYNKQRAAQRCLSDLDSEGINSSLLLEGLLKSFYNTMGRLEAYVIIKGRNGGIEFEEFNKNKFSTCSFTLKSL